MRYLGIISTLSLAFNLASCGTAGSRALPSAADTSANGPVSTTDGKAVTSDGVPANDPIKGIDAKAKLVIGAPLLDAKKQVKQMSAKDAAAACARIGSRLPTALELAEWSVANGSQGFLADNGKASPGADFSAVRVLSDDGKVSVDFYLDTAKYHAPDSTWTGWFWSSTAAPGTNSDYSFTADDGGIWPLDAAEISGARCMKKR